MVGDSGTTNNNIQKPQRGTDWKPASEKDHKTGSKKTQNPVHDKGHNPGSQKSQNPGSPKNRNPGSQKSQNPGSQKSQNLTTISFLSPAMKLETTTGFFSVFTQRCSMLWYLIVQLESSLSLHIKELSLRCGEHWL